MYDLAEAQEFAAALHKLGWEIIATEETCAMLSKARIPTTSIETFTGIRENYGIPPTLHPKIEAALTGNQPDWRIDLVYDIPYPLDKGNDVGGHTLLALAVKGNRIPVMTNADMARVVNELKQNGEIAETLKSELITKANAHIASHYLNILKQHRADGMIGTATQELLNGENPYQAPCHLFAAPDGEDPLSIHKFELVGNGVPCFTNIADLDCILQSLCLAQAAFDKKFGKSPYLAVAAKHGNPCGFAADWENPAAALEKTLFGNATAVWGGEFLCNFPITDALAEMLYESKQRKEKLGNGFWMLDVVAAPAFTENALTLLGKKKTRKLLQNAALKNPKVSDIAWNFRPIRGGFLRQPPAHYILDFDAVDSISNHSEADCGSMILAWATAWSSNLGGNEIALTKNLQLIGSGGGPATTIAAFNAVTRAQEQGHSTRSSVFAADAFFPFVDGPEILAKVGCVGGLFPKGGKFEKEVLQYFQKQHVNVFLLPEQFRGFCRH